LQRIASLKETSNPLWGKMSVGQMLWHCQLPVKIATENRAYHGKGNPLVRWLFKKSMYNDSPWRKNLPTVPAMKAREPKDFAIEKDKLLGLLKDLYQVKDREDWNPHPVFGAYTSMQWGQMQYKHLDHHLRQFGV
jgi:hypothetical protein